MALIRRSAECATRRPPVTLDERSGPSPPSKLLREGMGACERQLMFVCVRGFG
jgi:hypothetical protein